jgi:hypothetical protein
MSLYANGQYSGPTQPYPPLAWRHQPCAPSRPLCHPAVAALAVMRARLPGLRNAVGLCNAPATRCEFNVSRTALDFTVESSFTLNLAVPGRSPVTADRSPVSRTVERATLPLELGRA